MAAPKYAACLPWLWGYSRPFSGVLWAIVMVKKTRFLIQNLPRQISYVGIRKKSSASHRLPPITNKSTNHGIPLPSSEGDAEGDRWHNDAAQWWRRTAWQRQGAARGWAAWWWQWAARRHGRKRQQHVDSNVQQDNICHDDGDEHLPGKIKIWLDQTYNLQITILGFVSHHYQKPWATIHSICRAPLALFNWSLVPPWRSSVKKGLMGDDHAVVLISITVGFLTTPCWILAWWDILFVPIKKTRWVLGSPTSQNVEQNILEYKDRNKVLYFLHYQLDNCSTSNTLDKLKGGIF